jgi:hypothetical protein
MAAEGAKSLGLDRRIVPVAAVGASAAMKRIRYEPTHSGG